MGATVWVDRQAESEGETFVHPLARDDEHLIQDFMLTKVALLLSRNARPEEWAFEMVLMDSSARDAKRGDHPFLFLYTVVRYCLAITHADAAARGGAHEISVASSLGATPFLADFAAAVFFDDSRCAFSLWAASPLATGTNVSSVAIQRVVFDLLGRVARLTELPHATSAADFLPDPYSS
jgi:hypothetical protein